MSIILLLSALNILNLFININIINIIYSILYIFFSKDISAIRCLPELWRRVDGGIWRRGWSARRRKRPWTKHSGDTSALKAKRLSERHHHVAGGVVRDKGSAYRRDIFHHRFSELWTTERRRNNRREDCGDLSDHFVGQ